eukprot:TRINITY_DN27818_c0_g1_i1.p1 TRINITY_DN27818_c0_g1~~TRINITY_DN27818_c0_g1_i1.p1  ORF type:complete len:315 (-),score=51.58 TRINITY_DN27818_c0_g1_i1:121-1065(-)
MLAFLSEVGNHGFVVPPLKLGTVEGGLASAVGPVADCRWRRKLSKAFLVGGRDGRFETAAALVLPALALCRARRRRRCDRFNGIARRARVSDPGEVFQVEPLAELPPSEEALLVWLHGMGDSGRGWSNTAPALQRMGLPMLRFLFPTAATRDSYTGSRGPCPSWYDVVSLDPDDIARQPQSPDGLEESANYILDLVEPYVRRGVPPHRIFFVGYSQGGAVALEAALRAPRPIGGVLLLSSWLAQPLAPTTCKVPVHIFHGAGDPVVSVANAKRGHDTLLAAGMDATFRAYPGMSHSVCDEEVGDIARTLYEALQ